MPEYRTTTKKARRSQFIAFQGDRSRKGGPRKSRVRAIMRREGKIRL